VIVSGYVPFYQINTFSVNTVEFACNDAFSSVPAEFNLLRAFEFGYNDFVSYVVT